MSGCLHIGDAATVLRQLAPSSADMILTSPPYFRLRDYGAAGQLGTESSVDQWVSSLRVVAEQARRVLTPTGTLWLNLGDTYATHQRQGAGRKSLLLGPERIALALIRDGWLLRNKIVWRKANPMPTSVPDRLACTWEALYVFARSPHYFFDLDAIREPHRTRPGKWPSSPPTRPRETWRGPNSASTTGLAALKRAGLVGHPLGKNPGDVWTTASSNYRGSHRATFPTSLVERAVLVGSPEARCSICHAGWRRRLIRTSRSAERGALEPTCDCSPHAEPAVVLDPFLGSGTTAVVAEQLGRNWCGIELNRAFADEAAQRLAHPPPGIQRAA